MLTQIDLGQVPNQEHHEKILQALAANLINIHHDGKLKYLFRGFVGLDDLLADYIKDGTDTPDLEYTRMHPLIGMAFYYMNRTHLTVEFDGKTTPIGHEIVRRGLPIPDYVDTDGIPKLRVYPISWFKDVGLNTFSGLFVYDNDSVVPIDRGYEKYKPATTFADASRLLLAVR